MRSARILSGRLNRRDVLVLGGAASGMGLTPAMGWAAPPAAVAGEVTDMTMNSPSYATPIGYGLAGGADDAIDPLALAFR